MKSFAAAAAGIALLVLPGPNSDPGERTAPPRRVRSTEQVIAREALERRGDGIAGWSDGISSARVRRQIAADIDRAIEVLAASQAALLAEAIAGDVRFILAMETPASRRRTPDGERRLGAR